MGLFSAITGVVIETVKLPVDAVKDVLTLGNFGEGSSIVKRLEKIKKESEKADSQ